MTALILRVDLDRLAAVPEEPDTASIRDGTHPTDLDTRLQIVLRTATSMHRDGPPAYAGLYYNGTRVGAMETVS